MTAARLRAAFIVSSVVWALLLLAAPFAASRPHASPLSSVLIIGVYTIGGLVCHQLPQRSYHVWTAQMPVCARCAGIYFGAAVTALFAAPVGNVARRLRAIGAPASLAKTRLRSALQRATVARGFSPARVAAVLAVVPTLLTLVYEWTTGDMPSNAIRAAAGVPIGVAVAWLVVAAADNQVN